MELFDCQLITKAGTRKLRVTMFFFARFKLGLHVRRKHKHKHKHKQKDVYTCDKHKVTCASLSLRYTRFTHDISISIRFYFLMLMSLPIYTAYLMFMLVLMLTTVCRTCKPGFISHLFCQETL